MSLVAGPGWVDRSMQPIRGLFPLAVEQYLNAAVAVNAPGVTTVTTTARYYALHGAIAHEAQRSDLDGPSARDLLRRTEVVYALACMAHRGKQGHDSSWPAPHGEQRLDAALQSGPVDVGVAAGHSQGRYSNASWGFLGPYRGSEMTLAVLGTDGFGPGPAFDADLVRKELGQVIQLARTATRVSLEDVEHLADACLCRAPVSSDGEWLAHRFAGRAKDLGTRASVLGQTMQMIATAITAVEVRDLDDLGDFVMYDPRMIDAEHSGEVWRRWRGIRQRAESVEAWRYLWTAMCDALPEVGAMSSRQLGEFLADALPSVTVGQYRADLPEVVDHAGAPRAAEREGSILDRGDIDRDVATLMLGAARHRALPPDGPERLGFEGPPEHRWAVEELSPHWVATVADQWTDRSLRDFAAYLAEVMVNRAHRVSMRKAFLRKSDGRYVVPVRIVLQDGLVVRLFDEVPRPPSLRWYPLLSMGRQTGLFSRNGDGRWEMGPRGGFLE